MPSQVDFDTLKVQLEDTQASLAAALARIEAFRIHERCLAQELAQLRLRQGPAQPQTGGGTDAGTQEPPTAQLDVAAVTAALAGAHPQAACQQATVPAATPAPAKAASLSTVPVPAYITDITGHVPVMIINGNRKVPGSIVVTADYIDFVEVRARIKADEFVGFTTAPTTSPARRSSHLSLLPSCLNPSPLGSEDIELHSHPRAGHASTSAGSGGGGSGPGSPIRGSNHARRNSWGASSGKSPRGSPRGSSGWHPTPEPAFTRLDSHGQAGVWQILWRSGDMPQQLTFEATQETREMLHRHTAKWLGEDAGAEEPQAAGPSGVDGDAIEIVMPRHLVLNPGTAAPLSEPSTIISDQLAAMLTSGLPTRYQSKPWLLLYSTQRHGISLQTLHRRAVGAAVTVLIVRDTEGFVFGAFAAEPWRVSPRFFGTGETFVFQLEPHRIMYPWKVKSRTKNDFFMYSTPECLAVGGLGHFALWLDAELLSGNSGTCGTFGSPCLASKEEFNVLGVELWSVQ